MFALNKNFTLKEDIFAQKRAIVHVFIFIYVAGTITFVIMSCDSATRESKKIVMLCYKIQQHCVANSIERKELIYLAEVTSASVPTFTAAGFFEINRNTFLGILSATTTYLIIIIQFNI
ncbi:7tm 7 domain containing protein, partial [Asbolus verrucosus]